MIIGILDARQAKIEGDLKAAADAKDQAEENARTYEQRIYDAEREAADIIDAAKRSAEEERAEILAKAQREAAATIAKSRDAVEAERKKAMVELSGSVVDLSVEIASKIIGNDLDASQHRALAEKYLAEVGSSDANQS
jgi:F-type H+-transporting ATPase subunit b